MKSDKTDGKTRPEAIRSDLEEALRQSEASYHELFNTIRQAIYLHDHEGRFIEVNDGACAMYGYSREEFIGRTPEFLAAPGLNDFEFVSEKITKAFLGEPQQLEFWGRRKTGEVFLKDVHLCKGMYHGEEVLIAVASDITEQKRAEQVLRESEEIFREVFNNANDAVFLHELPKEGPGKYILVNDVATSWLGYTREELMAMSPQDIVPEEIGKTIIPDIMNVLSKSGRAIFESVHRRKDGSTYPVEISTHVFPYQKRMVALSIARDITQRTAEREALRKGEELFRTIIHSMQSGIVVIDAETHTILDANKKALEMIMADKGTVIGEVCHRFICPAECGRCPVTDLGQTIDSSERILLTLQGEEIPILKSVIKTVLGKKEVLIESFVDITDRKQREDALGSALARSHDQQQVISLVAASPLISSGDVEGLVHMTTEKAAQVLGVERAGVWLFDDTESRLTCIDLYESTPGTHTSGTILLESEFKNEFEALKASKFISIDDPLTDSRTAGYVEGYLKPLRITSMLDAVIRTNGKNAGVICFEHVAKKHTWEPDEITFACQLADQIALAATTRQNKQTQQALIESAAQLSAIIHSSPIPMFVIDRDHRVVSWNHALENISGIKAQNVLGTRNHWRAFYPSARPCLADLLADGKREQIPELFRGKFKKTDLVEGGYAVTDFFPALGKDGKWIHFIGAPILDGNGDTIGAVETLEDITLLINARAELKDSEARYSALFSNNYSVSLLINPDNGHIVEANDAAVWYYGYPRDRLLGMGIYDLNRLPREKVVQDLVRAKEEKAKHFQSVHYRSDGEKRYVEVYSGPIRVQGKPLFYSIIHDITDRKLAEQALRESETKLNTILQSSPIPKFVIDPHHRVISWNKALEETTGIQAQDVIGTREHWKAFYPNERPCMADLLIDNETEKIAQLYAGKYKESKTASGAFEATDFFPHLGEHGKWLHFIAAPIIDSSGRRIGAVETIEDITGIMEAEQELRESEERYSALFSNSASVSLLIDPDNGHIVEANDAAVRYYGYSRERLLGMWIYDLNRLPREKVVQNLVRAKNEKAKHFPSIHYLSDGEKRYVDVYSGPIRVQGKPLFYSIIHDITDRKLAEQALRESEERYRTLIDQLPDYVIVHREGILLYVNPAAAANLSYDVKTLIGKSFFKMIAPESHEVTRQAVRQRMQGKDVPPYEIKITAHDGTIRSVLVHGALIRYDGAPATINVLTDITPLKEAEEMIRRANEDLEKRVQERTEDLRQANEQLTAEIAARAQAEKEISRSLEEKVLLLREIHHRVKNNLQIITSLLKLQSRLIADPHVLDAIKDTQSRVRAMSLVHERIYRSPDIAEINLKDYLLFLVKQISHFYNVQQHQIALSVTMPGIMADIDTVTPLGLIMNELVSNSLKHAFPDGRKGSITIDCSAQGADRLRIIYHDSGVGMPVGLDWKTSESLGLRLVNSLVDQLDGTIELQKGEGTTFVIEIRKANARKTDLENMTGYSRQQGDRPDENGNRGT